MPLRDKFPKANSKEENMKKILVLVLMVTVVIVMAASAFAATETGNVIINANVSTVCTAIAPNNLLITMDGTAGEKDSSGGNTTVQCTNLGSHLVQASSANAGGAAGGSPLAGLLRVAGHPDIPYNLYFKDPVIGLGFGGVAYDAVIINGNGSAAGTTGAVVMATGTEVSGSYSDTVTLTLTY